MAHKKAGGSSRNGRDSESKRLGVKLFGGQTARRQHHRAPARHQVAPGRQRRPGQGPYAFCAYRRRKSRSATASSAANTCILCRHYGSTNRNGQKGTVPTRGRPGRDPNRIETKGRRGAPGRDLPFFFVFSRCHLPLSGGRERRRTMFARTPRLLLRPGFPEDAPALARRSGTRRSSATSRPRPGPIASATPRRSSPRPRDPVLPSFLIFERTDGGAEPDRLVRARPPSLRRGRDGLLDRPLPLEPRLRHRGVRGADRHRPRRLASRSSKPRTSSTIRPPARVLEKLGFVSAGLIAPRMSCARGVEMPARLMRLRFDAEASEEDEALAA